MVEEVVVMKEVLTKEMIDGGAELLQRLDEANLNIQAALWVYLYESNRWWLVFALPEVQKKGPSKSYLKIHAVLAQIPDDQPSVHWSDVHLTGTDDRFISMLLKQGKSAMPLMTRVYFSGEMLHGRHVEEAYIYRLGKATICAHVDIGEMIDRLVPIWRRGSTHLLFFYQLQKSHKHEKDIWLQLETFYEYTLQAHLHVAFSDASKLFEGDRYRSRRNESASIYSLLRAAQLTKKFPYATKQKVQASIASYDKRFLEKNRLLFSLNSTLHNDSDLDSGSVPDEFKEHLLLSQNVTVNKEESGWGLIDGQVQDKLIYAVRKNAGQLNIYENLENSIKRLKQLREHLLAYQPKEPVKGFLSTDDLSILFDEAGEILNTFSAYWRGTEMKLQAYKPDFYSFADLAQKGLQLESE